MRQFGVFRDSLPAALFSNILEQRFSCENCPISLVDIGANYGLFFRQTDFFREQRVLAFEPNKFLHQNYGSNFKWEDKAVSNMRGVLEFYIDKNHTGGSSLIKTSCHNEISEVSVCSLDEFISEDLRVDAIKIDVEGFEVNMQLCKDNYRPTFDPMGSSYWSGLAPNFSSHLIGLVGANVAQSRENTIWQGLAANAGEFDGFETLFTNEPLQPAAYEIAGTTIDASNVVAELEKIINAASSALYSADGFAIRIPTSVYKFYVQAQSALGAYDAFNERRAGFSFQGVPLIHCAGMSDDVMFATYSDNLYYGIGEAGDAQRVDLIDQQPLDGSSNVNVVMKWADGVQVANPEDVITYGIVNAGN